MQNVKAHLRSEAELDAAACSVSNFDSSSITEEEIVRKNSESVETLAASQFLVDAPHDGCPSERTEEWGPIFRADEFVTDRTISLEEAVNRAIDSSRKCQDQLRRLRKVLNVQEGQSQVDDKLPPEIDTDTDKTSDINANSIYSYDLPG